jgi:drug/metabolite transporter (DMT)-like permease
MADRACLNGRPAAITAVLRGTVRPLPLAHLRLATPPAAAPDATPDSPLRGILLMAGATVLFSTSDASSKYVTATLPPMEVAWVRYLVFVLAALLPVLRQGTVVLHTRRPVQQTMRGVAILASALLFLLGLRVLPIADAAAINFVSPLLITALAVPLLGERVEVRRWIALAVGLAGAMLAAQPGGGTFRPAAAFPLLSAVAWALAMVLTRRFAATERTTTTVFWTAGSGLALLTCVLPFDARLPTLPELALCLLIGVVASGGQWMVVLAYRVAPASLLAPFSYLQLLWSTLLGYVVFGAVPATTTLIGAVVIAASGLYTAGRARA